jgi:Subtilase family
VPYADGDPVDALNPNRLVQHGTGVAALMGAANGVALPGAANGDRGINGIVYNPMPYTIIVTSLAFGNQFQSVTGIFQGLTDALLGGARVLNTSFGMECPINPATNPRSIQVTTALRKLAQGLSAVQARLLLVPAAMNCGGTRAAQVGADPMNGRVTSFDPNGAATNNGNSIAASLGLLPNVLATGAIDRSDSPADFSNTGSPILIFGPGSNVLMPGISLRTGFLVNPSFNIGTSMFNRGDGTSFAAPLVSGTAALLAAINPLLTPAQLKNYITSTAMPIGGINTLKAGYAVRQLLLDLGLIKNDDPFTGVTKLATSAINGNAIELYITETRRRADGRSEAFAIRTLNSSGNPISIKAPVTLTHNGHRVSFAPDLDVNLTLNSYQFDTGAFSTLYTLPAATFGVQSMQYGPAGKLLVGTNLLGNGTCSAQVLLVDPTVNPVSAGLLTNALFQPASCTFNIVKVSWPPDNRTWAITYRDYSAQLNADVFGIKDGLPLNAITNFPLPATIPWRWYSFSPDGGAVAYAQFEAGVFSVTLQQGASLPAIPVMGRGPRATIDTAWSPDGSEAAWTNGTEVDSARRDANLPGKFYDFGAIPHFSYLLSWQW